MPFPSNWLLHHGNTDPATRAVSRAASHGSRLSSAPSAWLDPKAPQFPTETNWEEVFQVGKPTSPKQVRTGCLVIPDKTPPETAYRRTQCHPESDHVHKAVLRVLTTRWNVKYLRRKGELSVKDQLRSYGSRVIPIMCLNTTFCYDKLNSTWNSLVEF